ncbi:hypothetical protein ACFSHT_35280 [Paraburkholderia silviterrae]|uniref:Potassium-transporting ATPase subunit KdpA n=1 Tax=Paraburkholderia silviterrae TaxID=2528715 RepID=A0A4R5LYS5_9BURK|nr:hypothetical protein [Paraburkholderia silviterrae]TDG17538.1 hypothetical protein EYW47_37340 [Paraburkholderia silviterrae]
MVAGSGLQIALFLAVLIALVKPLGLYMARAIGGNPPLLGVVGRPFERLLYNVRQYPPLTRSPAGFTAFLSRLPYT